MEEDFLKPVDLKLARARKQTDDIYSSLKDWMSKETMKFECQLFDNKLGYRIVTNNFSEDNYLEELGIKVGELMHNLRTALDNLIYAMARLHNDPPAAPHKLYFPIYENETEFYQKNKQVLNQIPQEAWELVIDAQPFSLIKKIKNFDNEYYVLSIIHWLNNIDKHRIPRVLLAIPDEFKFNGNIEFESEKDADEFDGKDILYNTFPIKPNSTIFEMRCSKPIKDMEMDFNVGIVVAIEIFNENKELSILNMLCDSTGGLVNHFRKFFHQ